MFTCSLSFSSKWTHMRRVKDCFQYNFRFTKPNDDDDHYEWISSLSLSPNPIYTIYMIHHPNIWCPLSFSLSVIVFSTVSRFVDWHELFWPTSVCTFTRIEWTKLYYSEWKRMERQISFKIIDNITFYHYQTETLETNCSFLYLVAHCFICKIENPLYFVRFGSYTSIHTIFFTLI